MYNLIDTEYIKKLLQADSSIKKKKQEKVNINVGSEMWTTLNKTHLTHYIILYYSNLVAALVTTMFASNIPNYLPDIID